jgi:hypothetical protein
MRHWAVVIPADRYARERQVHNDRLTYGDQPAVSDATPGDRVALIAQTDPPVLFGLGEAVAGGGVRYTRRLFDRPLPAEGLITVAAGRRTDRLDGEAFARIEAAAGPPGPRAAWLVSLDMPIEAESPAEAVRQFWSYVRDLGPSELPAFVSPAGDELSMQAYLLGAETNLDPEEE